MEELPGTECDLSSGEDREVDRDARVREAARDVAMPEGPTSFDTSQADFWRLWRIPVGSVLTYEASGLLEGASGQVAVLVEEQKPGSDGVWLVVRGVGCESDELRPKLPALFKSGRKQHHVCYPDAAGVCGAAQERGVHLTRFRWYPAGGFTAPWLSRHGLKKVEDGKTLAQAQAGPAGLAPGGAPGVGDKEPESKLEQRLENLRERSQHRVSFAPHSRVITSGGEVASEPDSSRGGALRLSKGSIPSQALLDKTTMVKSEVMTIDSDREENSRLRKDKSRSRARGVGDALAEAVVARRSRKAKEETRKRSHSRSPRKSKKRRSKRSHKKSEEGTSSESSSESSGSSDSLMPPLKRKSKKDPGSVYKMLLAQATEQLAQEGLVEDHWMGTSSRQQKIKLYTYYQLAMKPSLDPRSRDAKELGLLSRALDLQEGDLPLLADLLAARLIAVETATRQGWGAAKYLELQAGEEDGTAPPHILLAAQRHSRQVEKAGGKGSWSRSQSWPLPWQSDSAPKGKGKGGKGKKGKGKPKGGKGQWGSWAAGEKDKAADGKAAKGDV